MPIHQISDSDLKIPGKLYKSTYLLPGKCFKAVKSLILMVKKIGRRAVQNLGELSS